MKTIRIGGVPEHFNMPWHWALEQNLFDATGIDLKWIDFPGGTGAMAKALKDNEIDIAVMLTEGAVADIEKGADNTIVSWFVESPLVWGIHVAANSTIKNTDEIFDKKYAISRFGSGSHLMASVHASQQSHKLENDQWIIVNNLDGAVEALSEGKADIFLWEKFMTMPLVDNGTFRRIGECPTPWPCFVVVVKNDFLDYNQRIVKSMLETVTASAKVLKNLRETTSVIADKFNLKPEMVQKWLKAVKWTEKPSVDKKELEKVKATLKSIGLI